MLVEVEQPSNITGIVSDVDSNESNNNDNDEFDSDDELDEDEDIFPIIHSIDLVFLKVGDTNVTTSLQTLLESARYKSNCILLKLKPNKVQNRYFIDCNPKYFQYILEFLKWGKRKFLITTLLNISRMEIYRLKETAQLFDLEKAMFEEFDNTINIYLALYWNNKVSKHPLIISTILSENFITSKVCICFQFSLHFDNLKKSDCYLSIVNDYNSNEWDVQNIVNHDQNVLVLLHYLLENENENEKSIIYFKVWLNFRSCVMSVAMSNDEKFKKSAKKTSPFRYPKNCTDTLRFCVAPAGYSKTADEYKSVSFRSEGKNLIF